MKAHERIVKVKGPDGSIHEMTLANARDVTRNMKGFKFYNPNDEPVEKKAIVGEQRSVEDAVDPDTASDPSPEDIEPEEVAEAEEEETPRSRRRS